LYARHDLEGGYYNYDQISVCFNLKSESESSGWNTGLSLTCVRLAVLTVGLRRAGTLRAPSESCSGPARNNRHCRGAAAAPMSFLTASVIKITSKLKSTANFKCESSGWNTGPCRPSEQHWHVCHEPQTGKPAVLAVDLRTVLQQIQLAWNTMIATAAPGRQPAPGAGSR
jgi:hypothetical protein